MCGVYVLKKQSYMMQNIPSLTNPLVFPAVAAHGAVSLLHSASMNMQAAFMLLNQSVQPSRLPGLPRSGLLHREDLHHQDGRFQELAPSQSQIAGLMLANSPFDATRLPHQPAGSHEDMILLMRTLQEHERQGQGPNEALKQLNGKNGHSEKEWTDLYITNAPHIYNTASDDTRAAADHAVESAERSQPNADRASAVVKKKAGRPKRIRATAAEPPSRSPSARARSLSPPVFDGQEIPGLHNSPPNGPHRASARLAQKRTELVARLRAPTPPAVVVRNEVRGGNEFTEGDEMYLLAFARWAVKRNPKVGLTGISRLVSQVATHHTPKSWKYFAFSKELQLRRIMRETLAGLPGGLKTAVAKQSGGAHAPHLDQELDQEYDASPCVPHSQEGHPMSSSKVSPKPPCGMWYDSPEASMMGGFNEPYSDADRRMMARYIASKGDQWEDYETQESRWDEFHHRFPQRSIKSWSGFYRRAANYTEISSLAHMFRRQNEGRQGYATRLDTQPNASKNEFPVVIIDLTRPTPPPLNSDEKEIIVL